MFILSQNKEKLYNLSGHIEGIGYEETKEYTKGKKEDKIRHTLMVYQVNSVEHLQRNPVSDHKPDPDCEEHTGEPGVRNQRAVLRTAYITAAH